MFDIFSEAGQEQAEDSDSLGPSGLALPVTQMQQATAPATENNLDLMDAQEGQEVYCGTHEDLDHLDGEDYVRAARNLLAAEMLR